MAPGEKCSYCGKRFTDKLYAPYCSRACTKAVVTKRGSNPDGSTSPADVRRMAKAARKSK